LEKAVAAQDQDRYGDGEREDVDAGKDPIHPMRRDSGPKKFIKVGGYIRTVVMVAGVIFLSENFFEQGEGTGIMKRDGDQKREAHDRYLDGSVGRVHKHGDDTTDQQQCPKKVGGYEEVGIRFISLSGHAIGTYYYQKTNFFFLAVVLKARKGRTLGTHNLYQYHGR